MGRIQYAPTTGYVQSFKIPMQFPNWIRVVLLKNCPVFVLFGTACGAYSIRPYDRVRAILQNTDAISQLDTCCPFEKLSRFRPLRDLLWGVFNTPLQLATYGPSKNYPVFRPLRGRLWGVFNTPLQLGTCDPMKYRYNSPTGYVRPFKKLYRFRPLRGRLWGVFNTPLQLATCDSLKYRYDLLTGEARVFGRWGGGGYRLRGRWA